MKTTIPLWSILSVFIVVPINAMAQSAGVAVAFPALGEPQVIHLDDDTKLTLLGTSYGARHMAPGYENLSPANWIYTPPQHHRGLDHSGGEAAGPLRIAGFGPGEHGLRQPRAATRVICIRRRVAAKLRADCVSPLGQGNDFTGQAVHGGALQRAVRPHRWQSSEMDVSIIIGADPGFKPKGMNLTVVAATDDQERELWSFEQPAWAGHYSISFARVHDDIKSLNLKLALHKSRFVEFTVKPARQ
jgi:hypothetical protein